MSRENVIRMLEAYQAGDAMEDEMRRQILYFVRSFDDCFERSQKVGHVTASAWIVDYDRTHALLHHHGKLNRWLQLGGHADGDAGVLRVAMREAREESGLDDIETVSREIFDVDAHQIPARGDEPAHVHYDIRFLLEADRSLPLTRSDESHDLAWVPIGKIHELNTDLSVMRMVAKSKARFGCGS